jgi:hypothetical protein
VVDRAYWSIPWNNSEIYTYIHPYAQDISLEQVRGADQQWTSIYLPGEYIANTDPQDLPGTGWIEEGNYSGLYAWSFPVTAQRGRERTVDVDTTLDFRQFDGQMTAAGDWDTSGGTLVMLPDRESSTYVSATHPIGMDLLTVEMTLEGRSTENMTFDVSEDNGTTWTAISQGTPVDLPGTGAEFKWRVEFTQDASMEEAPSLDRVVFDLAYTPESNEIWLETTYTIDIPEDGLELFLSLPFDGEGTGCIIYIYLDEDMPLMVEGTEMEPTLDGDYPGKVLRQHLTGEYAALITVSFDVEETGPTDGGNGDELPWALILVGLVLMLALVLGWDFMSRTRSNEADDRDEGPTEEV